MHVIKVYSDAHDDEPAKKRYVREGEDVPVIARDEAQKLIQEKDDSLKLGPAGDDELFEIYPRNGRGTVVVAETDGVNPEKYNPDVQDHLETIRDQKPVHDVELNPKPDGCPNPHVDIIVHLENNDWNTWAPVMDAFMDLVWDLGYRVADIDPLEEHVQMLLAPLTEEHENVSDYNMENYYR